MTPSEFLRNVSIVQKLSDFLDKLTVQGSMRDEEAFKGDQLDEPTLHIKPFYDAICFTLAPKPWLNGSTLGFKFRRDTNLSSEAEIIIEDANTATHRGFLIDQLLKSKGTKMVSNLTKVGKRLYNVELDQDINHELDTSKNCSNYPTERYNSYYQCDMEYVKAEIGKIFPTLLPIWGTDNMDEVTSFHQLQKGPVDQKEEWSEVSKLARGFYLSPCRQPCTKIQMNTELAYKIPRDKIELWINFKSTMKVNDVYPIL
jgi:hypothetical protein